MKNICNLKIENNINDSLCSHMLGRISSNIKYGICRSKIQHWNVIQMKILKADQIDQNNTSFITSRC